MMKFGPRTQPSIYVMVVIKTGKNMHRPERTGQFATLGKWELAIVQLSTWFRHQGKNIKKTGKKNIRTA